jgi:benzoyl-CoA reductase subunit C
MKFGRGGFRMSETYTEARFEALREVKHWYSNRHLRGEKWKAEGGRVVGYFETYFPEEIIYAAGMLPVRVLGSLDETTEATVYVDTVNCPFMRSCFDQGLKHAYDYLDGLVSADTCDTSSLFFAQWELHVNLPYFYLMATPHSKGPRAEVLYIKEATKFRRSFEEFFNIRISDEDMAHATEVYNENRRLLKQIYDLRLNDPPLISGVEALEASITGMTMPKHEHNQLMKRMLRQAGAYEGRIKKRPRLLITGSVVDDVEFVRMVENCGANVVADDLSTGSRYFWTEAEDACDPLSAICLRYINKIPSSYMHHAEERYNFIEELISRYQVQGVIIHHLKYCTPYLGDYIMLKRRLDLLGIPHTKVEDDHTEGGIAYLRTRIEAFVEQVELMEV